MKQKNKEVNGWYVLDNVSLLEIKKAFDAYMLNNKESSNIPSFVYLNKEGVNCLSWEVCGLDVKFYSAINLRECNLKIRLMRELEENEIFFH